MRLVSRSFDWVSATLSTLAGAESLVVSVGQVLGVPVASQFGRFGMDGVGRLVLEEGAGAAQFFTLADGRPNMQLSGASTERVLDALVRVDPAIDGLCSRVDVAFDFLLTSEADYVELAHSLRSIASAREYGNPLSTSVAGDWFGPEIGGAGRTLYLGAASSDIRIRFYQKGLQVKGDGRWVRFEVQDRRARSLRELSYEAPTARTRAMLEVLGVTSEMQEVMGSAPVVAERGGIGWLLSVATSMLLKQPEVVRSRFLQELRGRVIG